MRIKPKLVATSNYSFHSQWVRPIVSQWFDIVDYDPNAVYSQHDCLYTDGLNSVAQAWRSAGHKVVVDRLWETDTDYPGCHVLNNPAWFWYQESLWYRHLGYHEFVPDPAWTHRALMPMRIKKDFRDYLLKLLDQHLNGFVWSYQSQGRNLPNDRDPGDWDSQRYFNPQWYNSTAFSLVAESIMVSQSPQPFVTEKTFKPIAFQHPFVVAGSPGTLEYLHSLGFETWSNLFDQSYDSIANWQARCRAVVTTALNYQPEPWDKTTQDKLHHNHARFFDQPLVTNRIVKEIVEPLIHYAEA